MRTLTNTLLFTSSLLMLLFYSCSDNRDDYEYSSQYILINATDNNIRFSSDEPEVYEICSHDTVYYDNSTLCPIFIVEHGGNPKILIGEDSTIALTDPPCWQFNCQTIQLGKNDWLHTYVIDDQWLKDTWIESKTGKCKRDANKLIHP